MFTNLPESFTSVILLVVCVILGNSFSEEIKVHKTWKLVCLHTSLLVAHL